MIVEANFDRLTTTGEQLEGAQHRDARERGRAQDMVNGGYSRHGLALQLTLKGRARERFGKGFRTPIGLGITTEPP